VIIPTGRGLCDYDAFQRNEHPTDITYSLTFQLLLRNWHFWYEEHTFLPSFLRMAGHEALET